LAFAKQLVEKDKKNVTLGTLPVNILYAATRDEACCKYSFVFGFHERIVGANYGALFC